MTNKVYVVSEWLAKEGCEQELIKEFKKLLELSKQQEEGCIHARVTHQIPHPGAPGTSKFSIVLLQEYKNIEAFDKHCSSNYVADFFKTYIESKETSLVADWTCRLFTE